MKSTVKKISFSIILALVMACTLLFGVLCLHTSKLVSNAAGKGTTVKIEADKASVARGDSFTLKVTITPDATDMVWDSMSVVVVPIFQNDTELTDTDLHGDNGILSNFLLRRNGTNAFTKISGTTALVLPDSVLNSEIMAKAGEDIPDAEVWEGTAYHNNSKYYIKNNSSSGQKAGITIAFSRTEDKNAPYVDSSVPVVFEAEIKIDENYALVDDAPTVLRFGVLKTNAYSGIRYKASADSSDIISVFSDEDEFKTATAKEDLMEITIRDSNTEAILDGVKIGHDANHDAPEGGTFTPDATKVGWDSINKLEFTMDDTLTDIAGVANYKLSEFDIEHFHLNPIPDKGAEGDDTAETPVPARASSEGATVKANWKNDFGDGSDAIDLTKTTTNELFGTLNHAKIADDVTDKQEWTIFLQVTPECGANEAGSNIKVYQINVTIAYVRLGGLEGGKYSSTDGVTKDGVLYNEVELDDAKNEYIIKDSDDTDDIDPTLDYAKENFKPDQDRYWVYIPNDFKTENESGEKVDAEKGSIALKASVLLGYGARKGIQVTDITTYADGTEDSAKIVVPSDPIESGSDITITNIPKDSATYVITLTVTANDGSTTKVYNLHLQVVSVENRLDDLFVYGKDTGSTDAGFADGTKYTNENFEDAEHPEIPKGNSYFFTLYGETVNKTGRVVFVPKTNSVVIQFRKNSDTATEADYLTIEKTDAGYYFDSEPATITYDLRVTAEAGNAVTFTVTLSVSIVIEMEEDATFYFLIEDEHWEGGDVYYYRRAYPELDDGKGWTHGKEDMIPNNKPAKFVLGQIGPYVALENLFEQIKTEEKFLRIYDRSDTLVYADGNSVDGFDITWDGGNYVGTGWRIEYWPDGGDSDNGDKPADVVWISVLGDVDATDGIDGLDLTELNNYLMGLTTTGPLHTLEGRLAAYFYNDGQISAMDASALSAITVAVDMDAALDRYFYHKPAAPDPA